MPDSYSSTFVGDGAKRVASAGVPVQLAASSAYACSIDVTAATANTGLVVLGASTVIAAQASRRGTPLGPGDTWTQRVGPTQIWLDAEVSGEGVTFSFVG